MAVSINMPKLGLQMHSGLITEWYVKEGDKVEVGMPVFAIETDKITTDVEATAAGIVLKIVAKEGEEIEITKPCCYVGEKGELADTEPTVAITPLAKKIAKEYNLDYTQIKGSGPGGRIQKTDILALVEKQEENQKEKQTEEQTAVSDQEDIEYKPISPMRRTIADRLAGSKREIPHVYFQNEVDATDLLRTKQRFSEEALKKTGNKLTLNHLILKCTAYVLSEFADINVQLSGDKIAYFRHVNLGVAVSAPKGLLVPVIRNAEGKGLLDISREAHELVQKARSGLLMPEEYTGGTFTVTNLGAQGIDSFQAIINPPEAGILAIGSIKEKAVVVDGQIVVRPMMTVTGSFDHRLIDGDMAAKFMARMSQVLEDVSQLIL